jgi:hypothetical protein
MAARRLGLIREVRMILVVPRVKLHDQSIATEHEGSATDRT